MIKGRETTLARISTLWQVILSLACYWAVVWGVTHYIRPLQMSSQDNHILYIMIAAVWYVLLTEFKLGKIVRIKSYSELFIDYLLVAVIGGVVLCVATYLLTRSIPILEISLFICTNLLVLFSLRMGIFLFLKKMRVKGYNTRQVLVIADGATYSRFIDDIVEVNAWGYKVWALMTNDEKLKERYESEVWVIKENFEIEKVIDANVIDEVIYCKGKSSDEEIRNLCYACAEVGVLFRVHSELLSLASQRSYLANIGELPFLTFTNTPQTYFAMKIKYFMDFIISLCIVILISPIMLAIAAAIKLEDGGPVFFKQKRVGLHGRIFSCLKFRTMVTNAEELRAKLEAQNEQEGPVFKIKNDPRVTRIGRFLRKTSLDELPQFLNVLGGDMSIVGPRPPIPEEVEQYERWQRRRLSMKPGITCIWQVSGRNNIPFEEWMKLDMLYIDTWSLKLDLILFLRTIKVVLTGDGQ